MATPRTKDLQMCDSCGKIFNPISGRSRTSRFCSYHCFATREQPPADRRAYIEERIIKRANGCWEWSGTIQVKTGYGVAGIDGRHLSAHRVSYEVFVGPIPPGLCVLHRCDNRPCVNPSHLFLGTRGDNAKDMVSKERQPNRKLTGDVVRAILSSDESARALALRYGVSRAAVQKVRGGKNWRHISGGPSAPRRRGKISDDCRPLSGRRPD